MRTGLMYGVGASFTVSGANDHVFEMEASADTPFILHSFLLTSTATVTIKVRLRLLQRTAASLGTSQTEVALHTRNSVAADTTVVTDVDIPTGAAGDVHEAFLWDELTDLEWLPAPKDRIYVQAGEILALENLEIVAALALTLVWEEL